MQPNPKTIEHCFNIECQFIKAVLSGQVSNTLKIYQDFFYNKNWDLRILKNTIISLSSIISHLIIEKGVNPYLAKGKNFIFVNLIENSLSQKEVLTLGEKLFKSYTIQVAKSTFNTTDPHILEALKFIHNNLEEELTLEKVAKQVNLNKCYFCTLFKKEMNISFSEYLTKLKIEKAKKLLLKPNNSISDIATMLGFNSQSYFSTQFKKYIGLTPKEFRKKAKGAKT